MECIKNGLKFTILENRGFFFFFSRSNAKHVTSSSFSPPFLQQGPRLKSRHEPNVITLVLFHLRSICHLGQTVRPSLGEPVLSLKALKCDSLFARVRFPARNRRRLSTIFEDRDQHHGPPSNRPTYTSPSINDKLSFSPSNTPKKKISFLPLIAPSRRFRKKTRSFRSDYSHVMRMQQRIDIFQPIELDRGRGSTTKLDRSVVSLSTVISFLFSFLLLSAYRAGYRATYERKLPFPIPEMTSYERNSRRIDPISNVYVISNAFPLHDSL